MQQAPGVRTSNSVTANQFETLYLLFECKKGEVKLRVHVTFPEHDMRTQQRKSQSIVVDEEQMIGQMLVDYDARDVKQKEMRALRNFKAIR